MTGAKRTTVRIVSALLLLLIVAGVVFGTDAIMNFIKEFSDNSVSDFELVFS